VANFILTYIFNLRKPPKGMADKSANKLKEDKNE
jgi:hypothetical protein